jgi:hypothetical protein
MKYFYKNPSFENYIKLRNYINPRLVSKKNKNKMPYALFLYIVHMKFPSYEENYIPSFFSRLVRCFSKLEYVHNVDCSGIYRHIMGDATLLCMNDLDILWLCYYATGDTIYPDQVKLRASAKKQSLISDSMTKTAAEWSYNNHVIEKFIDGPMITQTTTTNVIDPLFYCTPQELIMETYKDE